MNTSNPINTAILLIASFLIVLSVIVGLILLALTHDGTAQIVIPILSATVGAVITALTGLISHYLTGQQLLQRTKLDYENGLSGEQVKKEAPTITG